MDPLKFQEAAVPNPAAAFNTLAFSPMVTVQCAGKDCRPFHVTGLDPVQCRTCGQYAVITDVFANRNTGEILVGVARWVPNLVRPASSILE